MDPLSEILDVEGQCARRLEEERAKAEAWLNDARQRAAAAVDAELARLAAGAADDEHRTREAIAARAAAIVTRAQTLAARLDALSDDDLRPVVWRHIAAIAPEGDRDRQDVEDRSDRAEGPVAAGARHDSPI